MTLPRPSLHQLSLARAGIGAVMIASPQSLPRLLGVDSASSGRVSWAVQMLGAREIALGVGSWVALRRQDSEHSRPWLLAGLFSDAVDAVAVGRALVAGRVSLPAGVAVSGTAGAAALLGAAGVFGWRGRSAGGGGS